MLNLGQIKQFYPQQERISEINMLREYLQYKILDYIFGGKYGDRLSFIGGTAIRIIYGSDRFSEDLDFDHFGISKKDFEELISTVKRDFEKEGLRIETRNVYKKAFRSHLRIREILYDLGLSPHEDEKLLIYIDTTEQNFPFQPQTKIINKFGIFAEVRVNPPDILLSQKMTTLLKRKRVMGRDIYDLIYLSSITSPNLSYLREELGVKTFQEAKKRIRKRLEDYNLEQLSKDVQPFVPGQERAKAVKKFNHWLKTWNP